jgi:SAM-dependent methyltransferase
MLGELDLQPGQQVLDIGCGAGGTLLTLREAVGADGRLVGVDYSQRMLATPERASPSAAGPTSSCATPTRPAAPSDAGCSTPPSRWPASARPLAKPAH